MKRAGAHAPALDLVYPTYVNIQHNVSLSDKTTFQIGGSARFFVSVARESELREAFEWARANKCRFFILSGGSNTLVSDKGFDGLVIHLALSSVEWGENECTVSCGKNLFELISEAGERGLGGWDKLAGIPGTIGGAVRGNAGAFGSEIKDFILEVRALDTLSGDSKTFSNQECAFAYRESFFKKNSQWIVLSARVTFLQQPTEHIRLAIAATVAEREKRHLQNVRAAGSYFMNPIAPQEVREQFEQEKGVASREGRVPAGWLIEKAGMKGMHLGGAMASKQHPNYLVNAENATSQEVKELAQKIKQAVFERFGIQLVEEAAHLE